ncbi:MAG TPA: cell division protein FtsH [Acholeplasmataceae bacterium]|nr:cell division protein FtsH [Acholeplasmataceae bacterium]HBO66678.1 cell division protein FtsH [Acholeplasmataceae bacterium]HBS00916.1 cell division protein FtsH [Acholeplasmataceae bacterium]HCZ23357.1 cell division protein FtsH [Acholeplasmataceae bacterium]
MLFTLVIVIGVFLFLRDALQGEVATLNVTELTQAADLGHIESLKYTPVGGDNITLVEIQGTFYKDSASASFYGTVSFEGIMPLENAQQIMLTVESKGGETLIGVRSGITIWTVLLNLVPMILVLVILFIIFRNANSQNSKAFDFAKNRARLNREKSITFKDVAGVEEEKQELEELIDFLKNPKKYVDMGARIPKGVLLVGSPGTGKTLLARAVAGEANVPFFSISGSDFVEMFVGVGASRVRDLFKVAKENSPCIIFIDEIDAVGRQRGAGLGGGHDEREQTLNQLLVEMDGFTTNMGIIIIAATNRPDVLDPALLRPGRFDRQITITLPDIRGREAILKVHARNKKLDPKVKLSEFASRIPGFSGADIENLLNEAALLAARDNRTLISQIDMDEAIDRVMMGPAKKSRKYSPEEKKTVAYHEAGHAVIGIKLEDANVVQKVTIIPRGRTGGYNLMVPLEEKFLSTKSSLIAQITSFLGGRVAEELVFDTVTTGAYNDFQNATAIARAMVTEYGMSDLGPVQYESAGGNVFLGRDYFKEKNFSDQVAHEIDKEVRHIITTCFEKAKKIITENRDLLDLIAHYLVEVETLTKADIDEIVTTGKLSWYQEKQENDNAA